MTRQEFSAPVAGGALGGWVSGDGPNVLALHGGPGMSANYLDSLVDQLTGYRVALFQQRGLPPSTLDGPFDIATAVDDVAAVLDHLGWETAYVVGHSWGGHLALHVARSIPHRATAVLCLDPLGAVGDGGEKAMDDEFSRRVPDDVAAKAKELDERAMAGEGTEADALTGFRMVWPAYFADWDFAPPCPEDLRIAVVGYAEMWESIHAEIAGLEAALPSIAVPVGFVAGAQSPIPPAVSHETAARIPGAFVDEVDGAGHMLWMERPGCVKPALDKLVNGG
jgi:pimeloyl-ACP methyl ester carboxylesterase